ncbi:MAG TPA: Na+/H+ antiporter [Candidatus Polarisedimenticolaceae bacterium]|nr:Na+/H+ antiporter [Candidatus Polarisedimenticolaceae bacterium]
MRPLIPLLPSLIAVLGLIALAAVAEPRVRLPAPVLLSVAGIGWALIPGLRPIEIDPHVVLAVFLPPLIYADAWDASWHDFRRWLRPILSLAIGLVAFTILTVGLAAKLFMPQLPWAACFLLGAILSPTDTVAVHAVLSRLRVPRRLTAIVGGESLVNDATGLVGVQLALVVVATGVFEWSTIAVEFARITFLGIASGVAAGFLAIGLNSYLRGTEVLFVSSLVIPYAAYGAAEALGASGILAVVVAGFVASWRLDKVPPESRVDLYAAWSMVELILNGLMFLFIGLEIPRRSGALLTAGGRPVLVGLSIAAVVIVARMLYIWPAAYVPLWFSKWFRQKEGGYPPAVGVTIAGWCGVRGAVSLAAALALPMDIPGRAEIESAVLLTIVITLIGQGATLEPLVQLLRVPQDPPAEEERRKAREVMLAAGIARLDAFCTEESCPIDVYRYRDEMNDRLQELREMDENERRRAERRMAVSREVRRAVWEAESAALLSLRDAGEINDRCYQDLQLELDREHAGL